MKKLKTSIIAFIVALAMLFSVACRNGNGYPDCGGGTQPPCTQQPPGGGSSGGGGQPGSGGEDDESGFGLGAFANEVGRSRVAELLAGWIDHTSSFDNFMKLDPFTNTFVAEMPDYDRFSFVMKSDGTNFVWMSIDENEEVEFAYYLYYGVWYVRIFIEGEERILFMEDLEDWAERTDRLMEDQIGIFAILAYLQLTDYNFSARRYTGGYVVVVELENEDEDENLDVTFVFDNYGRVIYNGYYIIDREFLNFSIVYEMPVIDWPDFDTAVTGGNQEVSEERAIELMQNWADSLQSWEDVVALGPLTAVQMSGGGDVFTGTVKTDGVNLFAQAEDYDINGNWQIETSAYFHNGIWYKSTSLGHAVPATDIDWSIDAANEITLLTLVFPVQYILMCEIWEFDTQFISAIRLSNGNYTFIFSFDFEDSYGSYSGTITYYFDSYGRMLAAHVVDYKNGYVFSTVIIYEEPEIEWPLGVGEEANAAWIEFRINGIAVMDSSGIQSARPLFLHGGWVVEIVFTSKGADEFFRITSENVGQALEIILIVEGQLERVISAPTINSSISGGVAVIAGMPNYESARSLSNQILNGLNHALYQ